MKYETRKKRGKRNARKGLIRGPAEKLMRRCPLLNLARKLLERVARISRDSRNFSSGLIYAEENF